MKIHEFTDFDFVLLRQEYFTFASEWGIHQIKTLDFNEFYWANENNWYGSEYHYKKFQELAEFNEILFYGEGKWEFMIWNI